MSLPEIKRAIAKLPLRARRQLSAHLAALDRRSASAYRRELRHKIDDRNPKHWVSLAEAQKRLG